MDSASHYYQPAEWAAHKACWVAWPSHGDLWQEHLTPAQAEFVALCREIAASEKLEVLVLDENGKHQVEAAFHGLSFRTHLIPFGDIWLRDTAPVFLKSRSDGSPLAATFRFNGWGGKYLLPGDPEVAARVAAASHTPARAFSWILEGGSVEVDGEGTCLTTRQCLLNPNRNGLNESAITDHLTQALGARKVLWLGDGLLNDHTDGHIDTIARFVAPGRVVCMRAQSGNDPNREVMAGIASELRGFTDAGGKRLEVIEIPSPGKVIDEEGKILPASYVNFYIANESVIVPVYGSPFDEPAVKAIASLFPGRRTVGHSARAILSGGGAFHCITQQQPSEDA